MYSNYDYETAKEKYKDLINFLRYLNDRSRFLNSTNRTRDFYVEDEDYYDILPVALIQLLIIILVVLIVLFMCKCNTIMKSCREKKPKTVQELEEEKYHDRMTLKDYCCFFWYDFKMRRRFRKRRIRRFKKQNVKRYKVKNFSGTDKYSRHVGNRSRQSSLFRQKSVRYRNRNNKNSSEKSQSPTNRQISIVNGANSSVKKDSLGNVSISNKITIVGQSTAVPPTPLQTTGAIKEITEITDIV